MKLYDGGRAPSPRRVRIFLAEKGISIPAEQINLGALQQRSEAYTAINPMQRVPALVLDDGTVIAESIAICRYFEALHPEPPLFGAGALDSALVEMWNRRAELHLLFPVAAIFQHLHPAMKVMVDPQVPAWGEANQPRAFAFLEFLDGELKNRPYIAGNNYTVADITALAGSISCACRSSPCPTISAMCGAGIRMFRAVLARRRSHKQRRSSSGKHRAYGGAGDAVAVGRQCEA
jgi:glutathione S-transferase